MKYLLDTNVFREVGKHAPHRHVGAWLSRVDDSDIAVSALTAREVRKGIARLRPRKPETAALILERVETALPALGDRLLPVTREIAELWGELLAESEKHIDDTGLAATARIHGLVLVTRNLDHVAGRGADMLDPYQAAPKVSRAAGG
jgi:predicted nucleic acid-binding protein